MTPRDGIGTAALASSPIRRRLSPAGPGFVCASRIDMTASKHEHARSSRVVGGHSKRGSRLPLPPPPFPSWRATHCNSAAKIRAARTLTRSLSATRAHVPLGEATIVVCAGSPLATAVPDEAAPVDSVAHLVRPRASRPRQAPSRLILSPVGEKDQRPMMDLEWS